MCSLASDHAADAHLALPCKIVSANEIKVWLPEEFAGSPSAGNLTLNFVAHVLHINQGVNLDYKIFDSQEHLIYSSESNLQKSTMVQVVGPLVQEASSTIAQGQSTSI